jgi:hypothetical protein
MGKKIGRHVADERGVVAFFDGSKEGVHFDVDYHLAISSVTARPDILLMVHFVGKLPRMLSTSLPAMPRRRGVTFTSESAAC